MTLILGTLALLLGPIIYWIGQKHAIAHRLLNILIVLAIVWIIGVHIIPEALRQGGLLAIVVIALGLAFPIALERLFRRATDTAHLVVVSIAALGLLIHAVIDGVALLPGSGVSLSHAIILHRIPVGMAIWWAVQPTYGNAITVAVFAVVLLSTAAGFFAGEPVLAMAATSTIALLQAFVAGSLIHVVAFGVKHDHRH